MEKLIELLNEYWEYDLVEHNWGICKWNTDDEWEVNIYTDYTNNIISKKYWFIKRLVENNRLNMKDIDNKLNKYWLYNNIWYYEWLLMLLSISDEPIDLLISLLK